MPDVVQTYVNTHDIGKVIQVQRNILELYRQDIAKYAEGSDKIKIKAIFDSIASQLYDKNRRFVLNHIDENGRMNRYESENNRKNLRLFFDVFERVIVCAYFYICILLRPLRQTHQDVCQLGMRLQTVAFRGFQQAHYLRGAFSRHLRTATIFCPEPRF